MTDVMSMIGSDTEIYQLMQMRCHVPGRLYRNRQAHLNESVGAFIIFRDVIGGGRTVGVRALLQA